jgi:hypothetical protein
MPSDPLAAVHRGREADHLEHDLVVGPDALHRRVGDEDRVGENLSVDPDQAIAIPLEVGADEPAGRPLQDGPHLGQPVVDSARPLTDGDLDLVPAGRVVRQMIGDVVFLRRQPFLGFHAHDAVAGLEPLECAGGQRQRHGREDNVILADAGPALLDEGPERGAELAGGVVGQPELAGEGLGRHRLVGLLRDDPQDEGRKVLHEMVS